MTVSDEIMTMSPGGHGPGDGRGRPDGPHRTSASRFAPSPGRQDSDSRNDWLNTQLKRLYDDVVSEPVPEDLLNLVHQLEQSGEARRGDFGDHDRRSDEDPSDDSGQSSGQP
jgi:hypothetical protein